MKTNTLTMNWNPGYNDQIEVFKQITSVYKSHENDKYTRELEAIRMQSAIAFQDIAPGDIFAGHYIEPAIGFSPQAKAGGLGFFMIKDRLEQMLGIDEISDENKKAIKELIIFWEKEQTSGKIREAYPAEMVQALPSDAWTSEPGIAFPLYRMSGTQLDFDTLLTLGIPGLKKRISDQLGQYGEGTGESNLYRSMISALELLSGLATAYAERAAYHAGKERNKKRTEELSEMALALSGISRDKPANLREAIQLMYLYAVISGSVNYGRMDEYLGDFYVKDIEKGVLNEQQAQSLINGLWNMIEKRGWIFDSRVIIGGRGRRNEKNADRFALAAIRATRETKQITPQLTLRFYKGQDQRLYDESINSIGEGNVFPMLYPDEVNIPAVMKAFDLPESEAIHYVPFGCGEYTLYHRSVGTPSGVINMLQALLVTLHNGIDPKTGKKMGLALGKPAEFDTYEKLHGAYKKQIEYYVAQCAYQEDLEYKIAAREAPCLYLSMLYDDCIKRGKPIFGGGVRYLGGTLETYGNTNTADSLTAIKKLVFEENRFSLDEMVTMLDANFEGYEKERKLLLQAPKFGNDNDVADSVKIEVDRHIATTTRAHREDTDLHSYLIVIINNNANTVMGRHTAASPDGREAWTYMANGNAPTGGMDQNGLTALLNSLAKPDPALHAGGVQNMKFSKSMFTEHRPELEALLSTFFEQGGQQAMINVLDKNDLENALKEPEKYSNLIVRVGGYCARFVDLPRDVQEEVLSRTLY